MWEYDELCIKILYKFRSNLNLPGEFKSPIHKAAGSLVTGRSLQNGKMSMGNRRTERPPDPVLYGGRLSGGFVNSAVNEKYTVNLHHIMTFQFNSMIFHEKSTILAYICKFRRSMKNSIHCVPCIVNFH